MRWSSAAASGRARPGARRASCGRRAVVIEDAARRQGRPRRLRRADDRARRPRPGRPADRAGDRHPVRPHPDQRDPHPPRPDDRHDPRLRAGRRPSRGRSRTRSSRRPTKAAGRLGAVSRSCSGSARSRRSARTAGCCSATGRSTGSAATTTRCGPPGRSTPSCPSWPSADATASLEAHPVQPLDAHDRHAQARRPLAVVLRPGRSGAGEGAGRDLPLLRGGLGLDAQPRRAGDPEATYRIRTGGRRRPRRGRDRARSTAFDALRRRRSP